MSFSLNVRSAGLLVAFGLIASSCSIIGGDDAAAPDLSVETLAPVNLELPEVLTASTNRDFWFTQEVSFTGNAFSDRVDLLADRPAVVFGELDWDAGEHLVLTVPLGRLTSPVTAQAWVERDNPLPIVADDQTDTDVDYSARVSLDLTRTAELLSPYVVNEDGCAAITSDNVRASDVQRGGVVSACDGVLQFENDSTQFLRDQLGSLLVAQPFDPIGVFSLTRESTELWSYDAEEQMLTDVGIDGLNAFGITTAELQAQLAAEALENGEELLDENGDPIEIELDEDGNPVVAELDEDGNPIEPEDGEDAAAGLVEGLGAEIEDSEEEEEAEAEEPGRVIGLDDIPTRLADDLELLEATEDSTFFIARVPMIDAVETFDVNLSEVFGLALDENAVLIDDEEAPVGQRGVIRVRNGNLGATIAGLDDEGEQITDAGELIADDDDLFEGAFGIFEAALETTFADLIIEVGNGDPGESDPVTSDTQIVTDDGELDQVVRSISAHLNFRPVLERVLTDDTLLWLRIRELGVERVAWDERINRFLERPDAFESIFRFKMTIDRYAGVDGIDLKPPTFNTFSPEHSASVFTSALLTANVLRYGTTLATGPVDGDPDIDLIQADREVPNATELSLQGFDSATTGEETWVDLEEPDRVGEVARLVCDEARAAEGDANLFEDNLSRVWSLHVDTTLIELDPFRNWAVNSIQFFCPDVSAELYQTAGVDAIEGDAGGEFNAESPNRNLFAEAQEAILDNSRLDINDLPEDPFPNRVQILADSGLLNSEWGISVPSQELIDLGDLVCTQIAETDQLVVLTQFLLEEYDRNWMEDVGYDEWVTVAGAASFVTCPRQTAEFIVGV